MPVLAEVNRAGLVTDFSQPGVELDEHGNGQRAAVAGLCTQATAAWLRAAVRRTELVAVVRDLFSSAMVSLVVTLDEGEEYTWLGRGAYLDGYYEDLSPYLLAQLRAADLQYVEILSLIHI